MWPTVKVTILGLSIAILLGIALAVLMNLSRSVERALFPYAVVLQTVPILAITPLLTQIVIAKFNVDLNLVISLLDSSTTPL